MTNTATLTLTEFLLARIAEDERAAREHAENAWSCRECGGESGGVLDFDTPRVLAECEAKRRIVSWDAKQYVNYGVLELLALPYADHSDYREEWRP